MTWVRMILGVGSTSSVFALRASTAWSRARLITLMSLSLTSACRRRAANVASQRLSGARRECHDHALNRRKKEGQTEQLLQHSGQGGMTSLFMSSLFMIPSTDETRLHRTSISSLRLASSSCLICKLALHTTRRITHSRPSTQAAVQRNSLHIRDVPQWPRRAYMSQTTRHA